MKKALLIVFMLTIQHIVWAQSIYSPLYIIEKIKNVDFDSVEVSLKSLMKFGKYLPKKVILEDNTIDSIIYLSEDFNEDFTEGNFNYIEIIEKDKHKKRFYNSSYYRHNIIHISHKGKNMYLVLPEQYVSEYTFNVDNYWSFLKHSIYQKNTSKSNYQKNTSKSEYGANMYPTVFYIGNINFRPGVFIINEDARTYTIDAISMQDFSLRNEEYLEEYNLDIDSLYMLAFATKKHALPIKKSYLGNFTAQEVTKLILSHSPNYLRFILEELYVQHVYSLKKTAAEKAVFSKHNYKLYAKSAYAITSLKFEDISVEEREEKAQAINAKDFTMILCNNWELYKAYYHYFYPLERDFQPFYEFIEKQNYEFTEKALWDFINSQQKK